MGLAQALDALIAAGKPVLLQLRDSSQPIGPGKCEKVASVGGLYRLFAPAELTKQGQRPIKMLQPIVFSGDDILMIYEETLTADGKEASLMSTVAGNGDGGLIIPGRQ